MYHLAFAQLRRANYQRGRDIGHDANDWTASQWAVELMEEVGEVCGILKRLNRHDSLYVTDMPGTTDKLADELADVIIVTDLLASRLGIELTSAIIRKFNKTSEKFNSIITLGASGEVVVK